MSIDSILPVVTSPQILKTSLMKNLGTAQSSLASLESQISTGAAVTVASDNPPQAANILQLQAGVTRANQYAANANDGVSWLSIANSTVSSVMTVLNQVASAVEGLSGDEVSGSSAAVSGVTTVVEGALSQLLDLANTQYAGQAIFSGTGTPSAAYTVKTGAYTGAGSAPTRTVAPGSAIPVSVTGTAVFGTTGPTGLLGKKAVATGGPGVGILQQMVTTLAKGTASSLTRVTTTLLASLHTAMEKVDTQAGQLGAAQDAMQGFAQDATESATALDQELSNAQNVTMAQALTNLQLQENAYQAAMYVTSQLDNLSLVNYL